MRFFFLFLACISASVVQVALAHPKVTLGIDVLLQDAAYRKLIQGKRIGLVTNHTAVNAKLQSSIELLKAEKKTLSLQALFAPEHGIAGLVYAEEKVQDAHDADGIPIYSLYGTTRRPTPEMLKGIDVIIFDMQDIGSRSYTYISTLFYVMEEAAKSKVKVIVADRPNPMGGKIVDGLLMDPNLRSFVGYINVPYCHGMTVGELALLFNSEYQIGCDLAVIPMKGWTRSMHFRDTGLHWIPTSPQIPEADTPFYYPATGILGELQIVNVGIGYTLPFKVVGAPWINAVEFADKLNALKFSGVHFQPFYYCPFYGSFKDKHCQGVLIVITDHTTYKPVTTQYLIIGMLKSLYPKQFKKALQSMKNRQEMFSKVNGTADVYRIITNEQYAIYELKKRCQMDRDTFSPTRKKYLLPDYQD